MRKGSLGIGCLLAVAGCSGGAPGEPDPMPDLAPPPCKVDPDCAGTPATPQCVVQTGVCATRGWPIGSGDGSAGSVVLTLIYKSSAQDQPSGLAFNPDLPNELWVVNRKSDYTTIIYDPGQPNTKATRFRDPAAGHFMHFPTGIAFGSKKFDGKGTWGTCGDSNNPGDNNNGVESSSVPKPIVSNNTCGCA